MERRTKTNEYGLTWWQALWLAVIMVGLAGVDAARRACRWVGRKLTIGRVKCFSCGDTMRRRMTTITPSFLRHSRPVSVEAFVCPRCGFQVFDEAQAKAYGKAVEQMECEAERMK